MGVTSKTVIKIECDNPNCPGNDLDPKSFDGWIRVNAVTQVSQPMMNPLPGEQSYTPPPQTVSVGEQFFCSASCAGALQEVLAAAEEARKLDAEAQPA